MNRIVTYEKASTTGTINGSYQAFIRSYLTYIGETETNPFSFHVPLFGITGATYEYYTGSTKAISANSNRTKSLLYSYTANTYSFSGTNYVHYDLYKINFKDYSEAKYNIENNITAGTQFNDIQEDLQIPYHTITGATSAITNPFSYTLNFPVKVSPPGEFNTYLLDDKDQFFVDTKFIFQKPYDCTLGDIYQYDFNTNSYFSLPPLILSAYTDTYETESEITTVTAGTFENITCKGAFFVYFITPNRPNLKLIDGQPVVQGLLDTFSPTFSFNNVADGDYYKLQINYDVTDELFSGSSIYSFDIDKPSGDVDSETIMYYSTSLSPGSEFLYRIGNSKYLINIFDVKNIVTTWSDYYSAATYGSESNLSFSGTVYYVSETPAHIASGATIILELLSQEVVSVESETETGGAGSSVTYSTTGGHVGATFSATTNSGGTFSSTGLYGGIYKLTVKLYGLDDKTYQVLISNANTGMNVVFDIYWGNNILTFVDLQNISFL